MKKILFLVVLAVMAVSMSGVAEAVTLFRLPLASNPGITSWFDHNGTVGAKQRYDCITNFERDEHHGTDFASSVGTSVYAGATGDVYYTYNGCPDYPVEGCGNGFGNHVRISHSSDGHVSIYAHLKQNTLISNYVCVACGTQIGQSGNSGLSDGPHLHFELWQNTGIGQRLDFFGGSCSSPGYWVNQNNGYPTTQCQ